jgi:hypothetical protein
MATTAAVKKLASPAKHELIVTETARNLSGAAPLDP